MATQPVPEPRVDFEHTLMILPPVGEGASVLWFAFLDEPTRWHRSFPTPEELLSAAGDVLKKLLAFECDPAKGGFDRTPNRSIGVQREMPNLPPRWKIRMTATLSRTGEAEWALEVLDDSAWGASGDDLRTLLLMLARRLAESKVSPQPLLATAPEPTQIAELKQPSTLTEVVRLEIARIDKELSRQRERIEDGRERERELMRQRRALQAARQAYDKHMRPAKGAK